MSIKSLNIGVDTGNRCMKTVSHAFVAGIKSFDAMPAFQGGLLELNGKYYVQTNDRLSYQQDKTESDDYFVLTLIALAKELEARKVDSDETVHIRLGVGLPPSHLPRLRDRFKAYFDRGTVAFSYNGRRWTVAIDEVVVFAQGYAAIFADFAAIKKEASAYVVDIGGYTTDVIALQHGEVDLRFCESLDYGIIQLYNKIALKLHSLFGRRPSEDQIDDMLRRHIDLIEGMLPVAEAEAKSYVDDMLRKLAELNIDLTLSKPVFVGGGAARLENLISASSYVRDPLFLHDVRANACGYEAFLAAIKPTGK